MKVVRWGNFLVVCLFVKLVREFGLVEGDWIDVIFEYDVFWVYCLLCIQEVLDRL